MTTNTTSIEKIVRRVLDEELDERNGATLEAIERLGRVLTEEVIPRLPDDAGADDIDPADDADMPEEELPAGAVPAAVSEALEALYASLTAEQANALEELFAAIAQEPGDEASELEVPPPVERP